MTEESPGELVSRGRRDHLREEKEEACAEADWVVLQDVGGAVALLEERRVDAVWNAAAVAG